MKKLLLTGIAALFLATGAAHAGERYPGESRQERSEPPPTYLPSWERTQRRYLPSYQFELERRKICGDLCEDVSRRRPGPFER